MPLGVYRVLTDRGAPDVLPVWTSVLVVVAHPDDESFGLGAILDAFTGARAEVEVLCLTHGEASTLRGAPGDLAALREAELAAAADVLGVTHTLLRDHPDGALGEVCRTRLAAEVVTAADSSHPDGLLVFDTAGVTGHLDHVAATAAGLLAAEMLNLPVLGWTLPETVAAQLNLEFGTQSAPRTAASRARLHPSSVVRSRPGWQCSVGTASNASRCRPGPCPQIQEGEGVLLAPKGSSSPMSRH